MDNGKFEIASFDLNTFRFKPACLLLVILLPGILNAQDPLKVAPHKYRVLLENEKVRVLEMRDAPGDSTAFHSHPNYVVFPFNDFKRRFYREDGKWRDVEGKKGQAIWSDAVTHAERNIDTVETHVLIIELKEKSR
jgi:hypothetical protein